MCWMTYAPASGDRPESWLELRGCRPIAPLSGKPPSHHKPCRHAERASVYMHKWTLEEVEHIRHLQTRTTSMHGAPCGDHATDLATGDRCLLVIADVV